MDQFKIDNFRKEHIGESFPKYYELLPDRCAEIKQRISSKHNINAKSPDEFVRLVDARQRFVETINAEDPKFNLYKVLEQIKIQPPKTVYVNWYQYDRIDLISFKDLSSYFGDIWYPASDDIDIIDASLEWILSIDHNGSIKLLAARG